MAVNILYPILLHFHILLSQKKANFAADIQANNHHFKKTCLNNIV